MCYGGGVGYEAYGQSGFSVGCEILSHPVNAGAHATAPLPASRALTDLPSVPPPHIHMQRRARTYKATLSDGAPTIATYKRLDHTFEVVDQQSLYPWVT